MSDRNNPIKFGPEWLRNLSREPSAGGSASNNHNSPPGCPGNNTSGSQGSGMGAMMGPHIGNVASTNTGIVAGPSFGAVTATGPLGATGAPGPAGATSAAGVVNFAAVPGQTGATANSSVAAAVYSGAGAVASISSVPGPSTGAIPKNKTNNNIQKVQLAKLRYGREEMLALYDRSVDPPEELRHLDSLYQARGKPPFALNTFPEEARDNVRGAVPLQTLVSAPEKYNLSRGGLARGGPVNEARGRSRMPFVRQASVGRASTSWHVNNTRMPNYNTGPEEEATLRPWNNNSNGGIPVNRTSSEPPEWNPNKIFRRRPNNNTNWRQSHARDENEEWRAQEPQRNRPQMDKWDREWGERPNNERQPQSWNPNRRNWVGNDTQNNDDNLPEWAVDNAETGAGTFDASGAFHGYSNDDTNLPKSQETSFPLARSHTHGSFARNKTSEDGSDEWWTSEKARKLSAKKLDAGDIKFMQGTPFGSGDEAKSGYNPNASSDARNVDLDEMPTNDVNVDAPVSPEGNDSNCDDNNQSNVFKNQYQDNQFEALMRSELSLDDTADGRNNFQSVMMTSNNGLRQQHQNVAYVPGIHHRNVGLLQIMHTMPENDNHERSDEKLVEKILDMSLEGTDLQATMMGQMHPSVMNPGMPIPITNHNLQLQMGGNQVLPNHSLAMKTAPNMQMTGFQPPMQPMPNIGMSNPMNPQLQNLGHQIQNIGMHNSALNSSLGLPVGPQNTGGLVMPIPGVQPPIIPNSGMQARLGFPSGGGMPMMPGANLVNAPLYMPPNNPPPINNEMHLSNPNAPNNMFPMHPLQHSGSQGPFGSMFAQPPQSIAPEANLVDAWFYEDPEKIIQGPFTSKEMYNWYRAGFFSPSLMVRRACETHLRPLGSYGPVVPFIQLDMPPPFPVNPPFDRRRQQGMGVDESLWSQTPPNADHIWMQQMNPLNESRINNLPMFFWDSQVASSAISSNSLLPEEIAKEMKTEDQILAQLRASQKLPSPPNVSFMDEPSPTSSSSATANLNKPEESFTTNVSATPNLEELQKLIQPETLTSPDLFFATEPEPEKNDDKGESEEEPPKIEPSPAEPVPKPESPPAVVPKQPLSKASEPKAPKQNKSETDKNVKKETTSSKVKSKKAKEEKKEPEAPEAKTKEEDLPPKPEKRSAESSPTKSKKEEKQNKKEQDKDKKNQSKQDLIKDGFTIVKTTDRASNKENKKKAEEAKALAAAADEADRKKKEEEKMAIEEEKQRKIAEAIRVAQEQQLHRQECMMRKAPWSVTMQAIATSKDGLTLAEIQRLEREKKVEQMKEQQHMMHIIAQQHAATLAREQEMQAGLGWAKKKASNNVNVSEQSLGEIQAEARKAAAAAAATAAAAAAQALDESPFAPLNHMPWASTHNGVLPGFWETQLNDPLKMDKAVDSVKSSDNNKVKKKVAININKKEATPTVEFEAWCTSVLSSWSSKIDVPTFVGFLKDIESPYEVKDYVKCYLGDTKESGDFARQFLERRSKLLRVGMVTPSDDLCSPAIAINPRNTNLGDYQEVKGKGKKTKKNKMLKVDARILGFSVTASEDRINVGDIDTV